MILKFWGAARTVTGSMHLLQLENGKKILLECGLYQGSEGFAEDFNRHFPCDPEDIDLLILSHAHIDHCGNIPQLVKQGFRGTIYCTHATYDLVVIMLQDSANIQERDAIDENKWRAKRSLEPIEPLYKVADVLPALDHFVTLSYENWHKVDDGVEVLFRDAGHMLGSASVSLRIQEGARTITLGFTGDVGRPGSPILRDPLPMPQSDYLISESTYGGLRHEPIEEAEEQLLAIIHEACVEKKGKLIIPAFSVGRTQVLVYFMDRLKSQGRLPNIPVYVDSPLAVNATQVFEMHPECFDEELSRYIQRDSNPFGFNGLHYIREAEDSKELNTKEGPFIVISASGMMTAGRILHHLANGVSDSRNTILVTGFCAEGTLGARLIAGESPIKIFGEDHEVHANIVRLTSYSGHADELELSNFIQSGFDITKTQRIFLVHGEGDHADNFRGYLLSKGYKDVMVPIRGETVLI
ncbi:MAG: MBL fold metallo-hydrolase [Bacteroidia bacterium]